MIACLPPAWVLGFVARLGIKALSLFVLLLAQPLDVFVLYLSIHTYRFLTLFLAGPNVWFIQVEFRNLMNASIAS